MKNFSKARSRVLLCPRRGYFRSTLTGIAVLFAAVAFSENVVAGAPDCDAPISQIEAKQIARAIRAVTKKRILFIKSVVEENYVPGAVMGNAFELDTTTGEQKPHYIRTDLVSVYMHYKDSSHVDVYIVRKVHGRWKIESKKDWFI